MYRGQCAPLCMSAALRPKASPHSTNFSICIPLSPTKTVVRALIMLLYGYMKLSGAPAAKEQQPQDAEVACYCHLVEGDSSTASSLDAMLGTLSFGRLSLSVNSLSSSIVNAYAPLFSLKWTLRMHPTSSMIASSESTSSILKRLGQHAPKKNVAVPLGGSSQPRNKRGVTLRITC